MGLHNWVSEFSFQVSNDHLITSSIHPVYIWLDLLVWIGLCWFSVLFVSNVHFVYCHWCLDTHSKVLGYKLLTPAVSMPIDHPLNCFRRPCIHLAIMWNWHWNCNGSEETSHFVWTQCLTIWVMLWQYIHMCKDTYTSLRTGETCWDRIKWISYRPLINQSKFNMAINVFLSWYVIDVSFLQIVHIKGNHPPYL